MWHDSARIDSPEVIKDFRIKFVKFNATCRQAVSGIQGDSQRVAQWLRHDQLSHWSNELKKREDMVQKARLKYMEARDNTGVYRKTSCVDEQKALRKAEAMKEEAMAKLKAIKKWTNLLERELENLAGPVNTLSSILDSATPRALAKLDLMTEKLEDYLRPSSSGGPSGAVETSAPEATTTES